MGAIKRPPPPNPGSAPTTHNAFRTAERTWKSRSTLPLSSSFHHQNIIWSESNPCHGSWTNPSTGVVVECGKIVLGGLGGERMGRSGWKGKGKAGDQDGVGDDEGEEDYAIILPHSFPGLVIFPQLLPPVLQRSLIKECLHHSTKPNTTSLCAHYTLPPEGLWASHEAGKGSHRLERIDTDPRLKERRERVDFDPVTEENWKEAARRGEGAKKVVVVEDGEKEKESASIDELLSKLRWTNIGWHYNWTSKAYDFDRGKIPLPPLIAACCRLTARSVPWEKVFENSSSTDSYWENWKDTYEPEAGIINFYQLRDSLTAHIDQSEVDPIRPLVSLSLGHSAIFLIGGPTRDFEPLAITLQSGDGLIMSGHAGRRVFHGLPRVLENTLPDYLASGMEVEEVGEEWKRYGEWLERGVRVNINVREVFGGSV